MTRLGLMILLALLLAGFLVRYRALDTGLYGDEMFNVAAAVSLNAGHGARLAPDYPYSRALLWSHVVALSMRWFGPSEATARLPSLLASLGCVAVFFLLAWRWFDLGVAAVAAGFLALEPLSVHFGSFARFYSFAQLAVLLAAMAMERCTAHLSPPQEERRPAGGRRLATALAWGGLAVLALAAGFSVQVLTGDLLVGFLVFCALRLVHRLRAGHLKSLWLEATVLAMFLLGVTGLLVFWPAELAELWETASKVQPWNVYEGHAFLYYFYHLRLLYPLVWFLSPVGVALAIQARPRRGLLASCLFFVPLAVHSTLFKPRSLHYLFLVLPFFFLLGGVALVSLFRLMNRVLLARQYSPWVRRAAILLMAAFLLRSTPWYRMGLQASGVGSGVDWRSAIASVRDQIQKQDLIVGGVDDDLLALRYYLPQVQAQMGHAAWNEESLPDDWTRHAYPADVGIYGLPVFMSTADVLAALPGHRRIWVLARSSQFRAGNSVGEALIRLESMATFKRNLPGNVTILGLDRQEQP